MTAELTPSPARWRGLSARQTAEIGFVEVLSGVLGGRQVGVESHFFDELGADSMAMAHFCARVRKRPDLPSVSMKDIYQQPTIQGLVTALVEESPPAPGETSLRSGPSARQSAEIGFVEVLTAVLGGRQVGVESHYFDELGADSMAMAHFCARVRKRPDLPSVSMKDIYQQPTIQGLVTALVEEAPPADVVPSPAPLTKRRPRATNRQYVVCGALQLLIFLGYAYLVGVLVVTSFEWISAGSGLLDVYLRSILSGGMLLLFAFTLPVLAKWILIGRWKRQEIPVWSLAYVRFWLVKTLVQRNILVFVFAGSPLYTLYLRALGAKVGRGVAIFTLNVPVCTDLLTIGDGTVLRKDSLLNGYHAHDGVIQTGSVTLGKDVFVGEHTVLDIESSMGEGAQLGHSSSLHAGQGVPDGGCWHGSPAQQSDSNYRTVDPAECGSLRRVSYAILQLVSLLAFVLPMAMGGGALLLVGVPHLSALLDPESVHVTSATFYGQAVVASLVLYFGFLLIGLLVEASVPRVLKSAIKPNQVYRLYGWRYAVHRTIARMTNRKVYPFVLGDSSYIVHYLRWIGYNLPDVQQTGSNFGQVVKHETPFLSTIGSGTVVADGLSIINADFSSTSFQVSEAKIGRHNFLGNNIAYPSQGRTGDNCLLATKVMVPIDGKIRENVGLLGSPSFEIPRTVDRDSDFALNSPDAVRQRLTAKNKHNIVTMGLYLLMQWLFVLIALLIAGAGADVYHLLGAWALTLVIVVNLLVRVGYRVLFERCFRSLQALRPNGCSIYDIGFWRHERYWKFCEATYLMAFNGTPFKPMIWRLLGVRLGRRAFDDGLGVVEKTFVTIGDDCTFNAASIIQCHSQEDGAFKSDRVTIGSDVTLGVGAFVHYGVTIGDASVLAADSFLMKGEEMPAHAQWGGNPASEMSHDEPSRRLARLH